MLVKQNQAVGRGDAARLTWKACVRPTEAFDHLARYVVQ